MKSSPRLLLLEDNPTDAHLLQRGLSANWFDCELVRADDKETFIKALTQGGFDLILSDYFMPGFDGLSALAMARERCPEIPFIFVSGAIGDEIAVESLRAGATDYVLKDRPARLVPAIQRALAEAEESAHRKAFEAQHERLVNSVDGIVWEADLPSLRFTFVSEQAERILGYPARCWLEDSSFWQDHIHPEDRAKAITLCLGLTAEEKYKHFEYRMLAADGRVVWFRDIVSLRTETGSRISGIMVDITRRKQAEAAQQESEAVKGAIMEAAVECIIVMDHHGRIIEFNPAAAKAFGYSRGDILGHPLAERIVGLHGRQSEGENHLSNDAQWVLGKRIERTALRADGSEFPVEFIVIPVQLGDRSAFTVYLRDITKSKEVQEKMRRIQAKLKHTNQDLLAKNQEIQNFYHTLSHELRTPLTSAREFISIVMDGVAGPLNETQLEYLTIAKDSCDQLRLCIDDLMDATRLETGKLTLELKPAAIGPLIQRVVTSMAATTPEQQIALKMDTKPELQEVPLDENRITQVLTNLLNNAIKFSQPGGKILIRVAACPTMADLVQVSVSDTGRGIPHEEQLRIFDRLYQVKAGDAATNQGVGLGLYLCRELVQLHGGNIWVESKPGHGSTFTFVLPTAQHVLRSAAKKEDLWKLAAETRPATSFEKAYDSKQLLETITLTLESPRSLPAHTTPQSRLGHRL